MDASFKEVFVRMMTLRLIPAFLLAAFMGAAGCSSDPNASVGCGDGQNPLDCQRGQHQEGNKCVPNSPAPSSTPQNPYAPTY